MTLKTFTRSYRDRLGENGVYPDEKVLDRFDDLVKEGNFSQVLFTFGKQYLEVALTYFETAEEYLVCNQIVQYIKDYNQAREDNIKLISWNIKD